MDDSPRHRSPDHPRQAALDIVRQLRAAGHIAYFAGGCVRDELLGREPDDYDVATDATPDRISAIFPRTSHVGASFGVVLVKHGHARDGKGAAGTVEVATFRADGAYTDRRRPDSVHFSDPLADAQRRDFTVNALFLDPLNGPDSPAHASLPGAPAVVAARGPGAIIDFVGGLTDLDTRTLRAVGNADQRLAEDHLRALRAVRLSAKLGFAIDASTAEAIRRHASELGGVSRERIGDEIRLMMSQPSRADAVHMLSTMRLDAAVFGTSASASDCPGTAGTVLSRLPMDASLTVCLAAWAIDRELATCLELHMADPELWQGRPTQRLLDLCGRWRTALCLSNQERDGVLSTLLGASLLAGSWPRLSVAHRRRAAGASWFSGAIEVLTAMAQTGVIAQTILEHLQAEAAQLGSTHPGLCPAPVVTGDDLIAAGFKPGPAFRRALELLYDAQLESRITTRNEGLELARSLGV